MNIIFTGGGTGGHIFPAIAVADELKKNYENVNVLFVGAKGRIEEKIVPANNYELKTIDITGFNKRNIIGTIKLPVKFFNALKSCKKILRDFKPNVVIGTGGFASAPMVYSAIKMKIPTVVQEGNSFPGKVTRYLSGKASKVIVSFEETKDLLKRKDNVIKISYPVRNSLIKVDKIGALNYFGLNNGNRTLFIFGGSQGAKGINDAVKNKIKALYDENINLIWQTGKVNFKELNKLCEPYQDKIKVYEFIDNMKYAYSASDLIICRAGMSSIMELSFLKVPAILVPFPGSADNHQEKNARTLENNKACILILQQELDSRLMNVITNTINNNDTLNTLGENIFKFSDPDSAKKIANLIYQLTLN
ncbi:MAG: undecaprenyldiphospho-muramoylpentapeptide beta-N-acetylglucosaminyltransferase [Ignavibacteria bacterium]|jgi:UDP-N-acetylglucosamine--N-acetylmuramyl-(pentapeptide) pyrophosphoryl-undecaprenol N-acetylglucosamine transferase